MSLADIASAIRWRDVTCVELVQQSIARLDQVQARTNAIIVFDTDSALARAEMLDAMEGSGPLKGIPLAHKDMFDRIGHRCSFGSAMPQKAPARQTAFAVARLEEAGSITLAALNMAEFALGPTGHNRVFGHCRNPWNPEHLSGGSSSGSAAAVASGLVPAALGSDTGGSIRIPAACCGVTGLKPTQGAVDLAGAMLLSPSLDCIGPIARSAADCDFLFRLLVDCGGEASPSPHRIGVARAALDRIDPSIAAVIDRAISTFEKIGIHSVERSLPDIEHLHDLADVIQRSECTAIHLDRLRETRSLFTPHVRRRAEAGLFLPAVAYVEAVRLRPHHQAAFVEASLAGTDALLVPALGFPVPTIADTDEEALGQLPDLVRQMTYWTRWINYLGLPALSIPCGFDADGLPIGLQLVGRPNEECLLLALARRFQEATDWHLQQPELGSVRETLDAHAS